MKQPYGFTLIELLITVSIIVLLSAISIVSFQQILKNSRDTQRRADLKTLQSALEAYRVDQGFYPPAINFSTDIALTNATGQTGVPVTKTYLKQLPRDPKAQNPPPVNDYIYTPSSPPAAPTDYCLYAAVENPSNNAPVATCTHLPQYGLEVSKP